MYPLLERSEKGKVAGVASIVLLFACVVFFIIVLVASTSPLSTPVDRLLICVSTGGMLAWACFVGTVGLSFVLAFYATCQLDLIEVTDTQEQLMPSVVSGHWARA